ncbi:DegT/DnrJ/EryC1/StrS family aminotransferase [Trichlorobacter ammonificans]|uniref:DegT/DnrJ/EryC1/StrS aminotransferase family protein n=1 Tax=Trichlorobacter ammonificans TaxID=2916410 RepID=A0ABN8HKB0_9BACT|nr:DegT/DnrJ/EryC1/StrS family aminotransferase [Trichlorobacter ammonificans]CAH2031355.1 conserved protein of unknown function [Trichlorobacter ammonificans]
MLNHGPEHIVGGMFGLAEPLQPAPAPPPFLTKEAILLANGRSGIALAIERLAPATVWLPSFFCNHLLQTIGEGRTPVRLYGIGADLAPRDWEWLGDVSPGDLVVVVDYFGFPCDPAWLQRLRRRGAVVLEDASQALLSDGVGRCADLVLYSPRKFVGVPDGGILVPVRGRIASDQPLEPAPETWWLTCRSAALKRREFDRSGGDRYWFELFRQAEQEGPTGPYAMSELSRQLLFQGFDYGEIARQRIANYRYLASLLADLALFPVLPDGVVPLGFPVRVGQRDRLREELFRHGIYPPLHWPLQGVVPERFRESHRLSAEIMTLPCDQRYDQDDMARMANIINGQLKRC